MFWLSGYVYQPFAQFKHVSQHPQKTSWPSNFTRTISGNTGSKLHNPPCSNPFDNHESPGCWSFEALAESLQVPETRLAFQGLSEGRGMVQLLAVLTRPSEVVGDDWEWRMFGCGSRSQLTGFGSFGLFQKFLKCCTWLPKKVEGLERSFRWTFSSSRFHGWKSRNPTAFENGLNIWRISGMKINWYALNQCGNRNHPKFQYTVIIILIIYSIFQPAMLDYWRVFEKRLSSSFLFGGHDQVKLRSFRVVPVCCSCGWFIRGIEIGQNHGRSWLKKYHHTICPYTNVEQNHKILGPPRWTEPTSVAGS